MHKSGDTITKQIVTPHITVTLRNDGIVHIYVEENTLITVDIQNEMLDTYRKVTDCRRKFVFEAGAFVSITKKARENAILIEDCSPVNGSAVIVSNLGQKILADYYYKFNKPKRPLALFRTKEDGIKWLKSL